MSVLTMGPIIDCAVLMCHRDVYAVPDWTPKERLVCIHIDTYTYAHTFTHRLADMLICTRHTMHTLSYTHPTWAYEHIHRQKHTKNTFTHIALTLSSP